MPNDAVNLTLIGGKLESLDKLCRAKRTASEEFKEACKAIGQEAKCEASVLAAFVNARVAETSDKAAHNAGQLSLLFEEIGL